MKRLSTAARRAVAVYLMLLFSVLLVVPAYAPASYSSTYSGRYLIVWEIAIHGWHINFAVLFWEILLLTVGLGFGLALVSLLGKNTEDKPGSL